MTCVGYDAEFVEVLVRNVLGWFELKKQKVIEKERWERLELGPRIRGKGRGKGGGNRDL